MLCYNFVIQKLKADEKEFAPLECLLTRTLLAFVKYSRGAKHAIFFTKGLDMKYSLQKLFQDSELSVEFNSKLQKEKFNSFNKTLKAFSLCMNANQNLIMSSLVEKSLNSENGVFLFVKTYEAISLGISRSTIDRFLKQIQDLQILIKVAEKEIQEEGSTKEFIAYAINADALETFLETNLKLNKYYKSIFGETKKKEKSDNSKIIALLDEIEIRDEKIKELEKMIVDLKQGEAVYDSKDVEALESQNTQLREKLQEMVEAYERLGDKHKELGERYAKLESADNEATAILVAKNQHLEKLVEESKTIQNVTDSQEYKDLAESNRLLESTANRLAKENEELKNKIENCNVETESEKEQKIQELESRLEKAKEVFKSQKGQIESLSNDKSANILEIEARIKEETEAKANAILRDYDKRTKARMEEQKEKINELTKENNELTKENNELKNNMDKAVLGIRDLKDVEIQQLKETIAKLESERQANKNAKGVPFTLEEFVDKALPQVVNHLNPTQRTIIENEFKRIGRHLTECYEKDYKEPQQKAQEIQDLEAEAEAAFPEPYAAPVTPNDNESPAPHQQYDLPF